MELLLLAFAIGFYLFAGYTAAVMGFTSALFSLARPRLGFARYWTLWTLEHAIMIALFSYAQWVPYALGQAAGRIYLPSYADGSERTGARASRWFRRLRVWRLLHWWTDFRADPLERDAPALFAVHPHGFLPVSVALGFALVGRGGPIVRDGTGRDPLIAVTLIVFWIPFVREIFLWAGCVAAERESMIAILRERSLVVVPGGLRESTLHDHEKLRLLFCHWGFLEVARKARVHVVLLFAQGENRVWVVMPGWTRLRRLASRVAFYPFPTLFIPFLFPHELRLRHDPELVLDDPRPDASSRELFERYMRELVARYEHPEDIDLDERPDP